MVKITNGEKIYSVTRGAFTSIYSHQGFTLVEEKNDKNNVNDAEVNVKSEDEIFLDEIVEKPISQWNKDEVRRFASLKEIDITGTKNVNEAKEIIKGFLEANLQK